LGLRGIDPPYAEVEADCERFMQSSRVALEKIMSDPDKRELQKTT
jgi:hypothetical protein